MGYRLTIDGLLARAVRTDASARRLARPGGVFVSWRERRFIGRIEDFVHALHHLPPSEAARITDGQESDLRDCIDRIIQDVETFIAAHAAGDRKGLERNQRLVSRVYELRRAFEAVVRHSAPNPHLVDLRRQVQLDTAHRRG